MSSELRRQGSWRWLVSCQLVFLFHFSISDRKNLPNLSLWRLAQVEAGYYLLGSTLSKCQNLQTLVLAGGIFSFSLVAVSQGRSLPLPFLIQSLKRLFLTSIKISNGPCQQRTWFGSWVRWKGPSSLHSPSNWPAIFPLASNLSRTIWIATVFCPHSIQALLTFILDYVSFAYLLEYSESFKGLSNVKQLALRPTNLRLEPWFSEQPGLVKWERAKE